MSITGLREGRVRSAHRHYGVTGPVVYVRGLVGRELDQSHNTGGTGHVEFYHLDRNGRPQGTDSRRRRERSGAHGGPLGNAEHDEGEGPPGDAADGTGNTGN